MQISAVDQLVVVSDGESQAIAMGVIYPTNGGNAQSYRAEGNKVVEVSPTFKPLSNAGQQLGFYPLIFSASEQKYINPGPNDIFTFRFNNATSDATIIAQGTLAQFKTGGTTAIKNPDEVFNDTDTGLVKQLNRAVFTTGSQRITNGTVSQDDDAEFPVLYFIGQPAYKTKNDISIFCECKIGDKTLTAKGDVEIRAMSADNYKVVIAAASNKEANATDTVINFIDETITLTAHLLLNGSSSGVTGQTYNWHKFGESGITMQDGTQYTGRRDQQSLPVSEAMVGGVAIFVCDVTLSGKTYSSSITINDIQDDYMIDKGRTTKNGNDPVENSGIIRLSNTVTYNPVVISKSGKNVVQSDWAFTFARKNASGGDSQEGSVSGNTLTITGANVRRAGGSMTVIIFASGNPSIPSNS